MSLGPATGNAEVQRIAAAAVPPLTDHELACVSRAMEREQARRDALLAGDAYRPPDPVTTGSSVEGDTGDESFRDFIARVLAEAPPAMPRELAFLASVLEPAIRLAIRPDPLDEVRVYSLAEVAAITGMSKSALEGGCREGRFEHVRPGRSVGMTVDHIRKLVARFTRVADMAQSMSDMQWTVEMSRRNARRATPRRPA